MMYVIRAGTALVVELGSFILACQHVQEINHRKLGESRMYLGAKRSCFPAKSEEVEDIYRIGVFPFR